MKVIIKFPQVVVEQKEIEISIEEYEQLQESSDYIKSDFVWSNLTEQEQNHVPGGRVPLVEAVDIGYCGIEEAPYENPTEQAFEESRRLLGRCYCSGDNNSTIK